MNDTRNDTRNGARKEGSRMEAKIFFGSYRPVVLKRALTYAGEDGFVASMPQLIHARTGAPYDNILWNTWFSSCSEENVVTTPGGNPVIVVIHGGGIYAAPERFEKMYYASTDHRSEHGYTGQFAAKISQREARNVLAGKLPDGAEVPVYPYEEFKRGIADLPMRYGVVLDYELARQSPSGYVEFDVLKDDPNLIVPHRRRCRGCGLSRQVSGTPQHEADGPLAPLQQHRSRPTSDEHPVPGRQRGRPGQRCGRIRPDHADTAGNRRPQRNRTERRRRRGAGPRPLRRGSTAERLVRTCVTWISALERSGHRVL